MDSYGHIEFQFPNPVYVQSTKSMRIRIQQLTFLGPKWHNNHHKTRSSRHTSRARTWLCLRTTLGHGGAWGTNCGTEDLSMGDMGYKMLNSKPSHFYILMDEHPAMPAHASSCQLMPALLIFQTSPGGWASPVWILFQRGTEVQNNSWVPGSELGRTSGKPEIWG